MVGGTSVKVLAMLGWLLELKHLELCSQGLLIPASALEVGGGRRRAHWGNGGWSTQGLAISGPAIRTRGQGLSICGLSLATCLAHRLLDGPSLPMPSSLGRLANGPVSGVLDTAGWRRSRGGGGATTAGPAAGIPGAGAAPGTVAAAPVALPTTLAPPGGSPRGGAWGALLLRRRGTRWVSSSGVPLATGGATEEGGGGRSLGHG
jgi:hypothetical protein